jgi:hypothetical protein
MTQIRPDDCSCLIEMQAAADALAESSRLLAESIGLGFVDLVEERFALVRAAKSRLRAEMTDFFENRAAIGQK